MRILLQRVLRGEVRIHPTSPDEPLRVSGRINHGFVLLVGVTHTDSEDEVRWMADKIPTLRLFADADGKMNRDLLDVGGALLVVSQFTLYGDARKGRRPSFIGAAAPGRAEHIYNLLVEELRRRVPQVETGEFGAMMEVDLVNDGPVTLWLERDAAPQTP